MLRLAKRTVITLSVLLAGCAAHAPKWIRNDDVAGGPARELVQVDKKVRDDSMTWDVSKRTVEGRPWLSAGPEQRTRLEMLANQVDDEVQFKAGAVDLLEQMLARGRTNLTIAAAGTPEASISEDDFAKVAQSERARLAALQTPREREQWVDAIKDALPTAEPHPGGALRILSALPAAPFVYGWIWNHAAHEWRGENWHDFQNPQLYVPATASDDLIRQKLDQASEEELLRFYSPIIAQEAGAKETPDFRDDIPGRAELIADAEGNPIGHVDTTRPTVYGYVSRAMLDGEWHNQVNYSLWYHDHPELKPRDPEAGRVEGELVRITLDKRNQPLLSEAVYACGCYHRIYPLAPLEVAARAQYGEPISGKFSLADRNTHKIDAIIPELGGEFDIENPHPLVYLRSGFHLPAIVVFGQDRPASERQEKSYSLLPERAMETLRWGDKTASFFGRDGLVRGADRPEAWMMYPSGLYHAGTPRIKGLHKIHFDQYDYNDPKLLETMLRIPTHGDVLNDVADFHSSDSSGSSELVLGKVQR